MAIDILKLVKASKIFAGLDEHALKILVDKLEHVYLPKNRILFRQGEMSNAIYLLVTGKIGLFAKKGKNELMLLGEAIPGETIGELGALSNEPRAITSKALENSVLLKLPGDAFFELARDFPSILHSTITALVNRSRKLVHKITAERSIQKHVAIIPANKKSSLNNFAIKIHSIIQKIPEITILSEYDAAFIEQKHTTTSLQALVEDLEKKHESILYFLKSHNSLLAKICFEKTDMVYIASNNHLKPFISRYVIEKIANLPTPHEIKPDFILLHEDEKNAPRYTSKWLKPMHFNLNHHIRINQEKDMQRMLRFMRGKAVGLVLGGGGIRSWAHIGVIMALEKSNIPIDIIGGTSGGALIGAYYALKGTLDDSKSQLQRLSDVTRETVSIKNLTWPAISIFSSKTYTENQKRLYGRNRIENLWMPFFCVVSNLLHNVTITRQKGYLWKAIRSTTAVPGIFPPVVINGELHVDGGIMNNLPVDVMRRLLGGRGIVIAAELTGTNKKENKYNFPPVLTFWKTMLSKLGIAYKTYRFPHFIDTCLKALLAGASLKQRENGLKADVLVKPDLSDFGLLHLPKGQESKLIAIGYRAALKALKKWKKDQRGQVHT